MTKGLKQYERERHAKARRQFAMVRNELRAATVPRLPADGPVSMAVKAEDPTIRAIIDAAMKERRSNHDAE